MLIRLRAPVASDAAVLYPKLVGTGVTDTLAWDGPSCRREFAEALDDRANTFEAGHLFCVIVEAAAGEPIGCADVRSVDPPQVGGVGLWIGPQHHGQGFGTATVAQLVQEGFRMGYRRLEATVFVGNDASRRIFENNQFRFVRTLERAIEKRGRWVDEWLFAIEARP